MTTGVLGISFSTNGELMRFAAQLRIAGGFDTLLKKMQVDIAYGAVVMFCKLEVRERWVAEAIIKLADEANHGVVYITDDNDDVYLNTLEHNHLFNMFHTRREVVIRASGPSLSDYKGENHGLDETTK
jgi:hypothetical protein